jgi:hypothetical protein
MRGWERGDGGIGRRALWLFVFFVFFVVILSANTLFVPAGNGAF